MKKAMVAALMIAAVCAAGAAGAMKCPGMHGAKGSCAVPEKGRMRCCCPMHAEMAGKMMDREIIATQDGGIVLLTGMKLVKYDKDLNVQKEIELKCDAEGMQKAMKEMCGACPMCRRMKEKCGSKDRCGGEGER